VFVLILSLLYDQLAGPLGLLLAQSSSLAGRVHTEERMHNISANLMNYINLCDHVKDIRYMTTSKSNAPWEGRLWEVTFKSAMFCNAAEGGPQVRIPLYLPSARCITFRV